MTKTEKFLTAALVLAIITAFISVIFDNSVLVAAVNVILVSALIAFTYMYVKHTKKLADKAEEQKQVMIDGNINLVAPLIELRLFRSQPPSLGEWAEIEYRNIGRGPALQFRIWIEFGDGPLYRSKAFFVQLVPSDGKWRQTPSIPTEIQGDPAGTVSPLVRAQYNGTFGERKTYESFLVFPTNVPPMLEFGEAQESIPVENLRWLSLQQSIAEDNEQCY